MCSFVGVTRLAGEGYKSGLDSDAWWYLCDYVEDFDYCVIEYEYDFEE